MDKIKMELCQKMIKGISTANTCEYCDNSVSCGKLWCNLWCKKHEVNVWGGETCKYFVNANTFGAAKDRMNAFLKDIEKIIDENIFKMGRIFNKIRQETITDDMHKELAGSVLTLYETNATLYRIRDFLRSATKEQD